MTLPFLISVPHAGLRVPSEAKPYCVLTPQQIAADGDVGAAEIYTPLKAEAAFFVTTDVARAIIDLNREEDDLWGDGVVKSHTCWDVPVYDPRPPDDVVETLLARHYRPYHAQLTALAGKVRLGVDCHTMAEEGPPVGPDPGRARPAVCLSNGDGTCPTEWIERLSVLLRKQMNCTVAINDPFKGGYITRAHSNEMPWLQIEFSRASFLTNAEKGESVLAALRDLSNMLD